MMRTAIDTNVLSAFWSKKPSAPDNSRSKAICAGFSRAEAYIVYLHHFADGAKKRKRLIMKSVAWAELWEGLVGERVPRLLQEVHMPARNVALKDRLSRYREINISVTGRNSGRTISIPVWFVLEGEKLCLLPVQGSDTQWYKNVLKNPSIRVDARGAEVKLQAVPITDAKGVSSVVEKFRDKYGAGDVEKYYSKFDVAVLAQMP